MPTEQPTIQPSGFRALALQITTALWDDIHVNVSGFVFFALLIWGIAHPAQAAQCREIMTYAGEYLFVAAKHK